MTMTFKEILGERNLRLYKLAVYRQLVYHLEEYVGMEGSEPDKTIDAEEAGIVPQHVLQSVLQELGEACIKPLSTSITEIESLEVSVEEEEEEEENDEDDEESQSAEGTDAQSGDSGKEDRKAGAAPSSDGAGRRKAKSIQLRN